MRFSLDETYDKREVFMIGVRRYIAACVLCILLVGVNQCFSIIETLTLYPQFFVLYFVTSLMSDVLNNYARGIEKVSDVAVGGIIGSVSMLTLNVLFLLVFKWGLVGYFVANCLSFASTDLYLLIKLKIWKVISWKPENRSLKKEMVAYSVPMGLGNIGWWINNVSDRYIVTWICGLAANGVYSVAYKIPSLLSMFQQIFNQASMNMWGLTPEFLDVLEEGFKEFFEKEVPGNPLKAEYLIPIFIGELLEQGKMSVKVLKTNDTWYGMTYHEDVVAVKDSFKKMLADGVYKADLFTDL